MQKLLGKNYEILHDELYDVFKSNHQNNRIVVQKVATHLKDKVNTSLEKIKNSKSSAELDNNELRKLLEGEVNYDNFLQLLKNNISGVKLLEELKDGDVNDKLQDLVEFVKLEQQKLLILSDNKDFVEEFFVISALLDHGCSGRVTVRYDNLINKYLLNDISDKILFNIFVNDFVFPVVNLINKVNSLDILGVGVNRMNVFVNNLEEYYKVFCFDIIAMKNCFLKDVSNEDCVDLIRINKDKFVDLDIEDMMSELKISEDQIREIAARIFLNDLQERFNGVEINNELRDYQTFVNNIVISQEPQTHDRPNTVPVPSFSSRLCECLTGCFGVGFSLA